MLIGINPILGPELLFTLRSMGHGDEIAIVDGNYPAQSDGKNLVRADGLGLIPVLDAVLSVMPLDLETDDSFMRTCNYEHPEDPDPVHLAIDEQVARRYPNLSIKVDAGDVIYDRIIKCHTIVASSETALYANVVLRKGVVTSD